MGFGGFLKKALKSPLTLAKVGHNSTKKLLKGDIKGSLKTGLSGGLQMGQDMSPIKMGVMKRFQDKLGPKQAQPMAAPALPQVPVMPQMEQVAPQFSPQPIMEEDDFLGGMRF